MIFVYVKCGYIGYALKLFDHMSLRDLVSWTSVISGYVGDILELKLKWEPCTALHLSRQKKWAPNLIYVIKVIFLHLSYAVAPSF
jgi:hypothetical protein